MMTVAFQSLNFAAHPEPWYCVCWLMCTRHRREECSHFFSPFCRRRKMWKSWQLTGNQPEHCEVRHVLVKVLLFSFLPSGTQIASTYLSSQGGRECRVHALHMQFNACGERFHKSIIFTTHITPRRVRQSWCMTGTEQGHARPQTCSNTLSNPSN